MTLKNRKMDYSADTPLYTFDDLRFWPEAYRTKDGRVHEVQRADMTFDNGVGVRVRLGTATGRSNGTDRYEVWITRHGRVWYLNPVTLAGARAFCSREIVTLLMGYAQKLRKV